MLKKNISSLNNFNLNEFFMRNLSLHKLDFLFPSEIEAFTTIEKLSNLIIAQ